MCALICYFANVTKTPLEKLNVDSFDSAVAIMHQYNGDVLITQLT